MSQTYLRVLLDRLTAPMVLRGVATYIEGERDSAFRETPNSYYLSICGQLLPIRPIVALAVRGGLGETLTGEDMASSNTTRCRERLEALGFTFVSR